MCPVDSCVPPVDVTRMKRHRDCFFFKTRIREHWAHALADTGASENFISEELAKFLELELHPRKQALNVRLADVSARRCEMFARTTVHIGSWSARMDFVVLPTGVPLVLGMHFFDRFEPHIL